MTRREEIKRRAYDALESDEVRDHYRGVRTFLAVFIVLNLISVALNTVPTIVARYRLALTGFEVLAVAVISVELAVRVWACTIDPRYAHPVLGRLRYLTRPMTLIDIASIAPSYVSVFGLDLRFLRLVRLVRLLRVLKLGRYSEGLDRLDDVFRRKQAELVSSFVFIGIVVTLASGVMYFAEHEAQPAVFSTLPEAFWWVTLMMAGEFSVAPSTLLGRVLGVVVALLGVGVFALPAGIIASGFLEQLRDEPDGGGRAPERQSGPPRHEKGRS